MKNDKDTKDLVAFLNMIKEQYMPDVPPAKTGIGHEIEHLKGVIHRTDEILNTLEGVKKDTDINQVNINKDLATTIAVLHDIGNTVNRQDHGDIGMGIIRGRLTIGDILNKPFINNSLQNNFLNNDEKQNILSCLKNNCSGMH